MKPGFTRKTVICSLVMVVFCSGCLSMRDHPVGIWPVARETGTMPYEVIGEAEGVSSSFTLLWIFPVTPRISFTEAVSDALRSRGGDNMIEITSWRERNIYLVGTVNVLHVKGKVIRYIK